MKSKLFVGAHDFSSFAASSGDEETDRTRLLTREIFNSQFFARKGSAFRGRGFLQALQAEEINLAELAAENAECDGENEIVELIYQIRGKSFLRYMVRKIVGTLMDVGRGKLKPADIPALFEMRDRSKSGVTMSPQGLYLVSVEYPEVR